MPEGTAHHPATFLTMRTVAALVVLATFAVARPASADLTAFVGANQTPANRTVTGAALGLSLIIIGFEVEYASTSEDQEAAAPALTTGMVNMHVQTPFGISGLQFYGTVGGGGYRERLGDRQETSFGANVGGGVKISIAGPLRVRFDYRLFTLRGAPLHGKPQRLYAGLNLAF